MPDYCNEVSLKLTPSGYITPNSVALYRESMEKLGISDELR
jgi:hypothetical protein